MNHFCARQRVDGRWDYTLNSQPWGYCREYKPIPEDTQYLPAETIRQENEKMEPLRGNFHTNGHATEKEACECYKRFLLDTRLSLRTSEPEDANQQHRCEVCKKFTACYAMVGPYRIFTLCPEHETRENVAALLKVGQSWES